MNIYVHNKITFASDFNDKSMQKVLSTILRGNNTAPSSLTSAKFSIEELCRYNRMSFDFNALIPMPEELDMETDIDPSLGHTLYRAYQNLPHILASRIIQAESIEDIFTDGSENDVRRQYDTIIRQIEQIELAENSSPFVAEIGRKLMALYLPVISHFETYRWKSSEMPEIDCFSVFSTADKMDIEVRMKKALKITSLHPLSLLDFLETEAGKNMFALGEKCYANIQKYGYAAFSDWQLANWGTGSNALGTSVDWDARQISFLTSINMPEPVALALYKMFPEVEFEWKYMSSEYGINVGIVSSKNSEYTSHKFADLSEEAYNAHREYSGMNKKIPPAAIELPF